jgi:hypothetical protein
VPESFVYTQVNEASGAAGWAPLLDLTIAFGTTPIVAAGLLDSGATVNVLPWELGIQLGLDWERQRIPVQLAGNLSRGNAYAVVLSAQVAGFEPIKLAFAWTQIPESKLLLGQINFFREFDVCFFGSENRFEIGPRPMGTG